MAADARALPALDFGQQALRRPSVPRRLGRVARHNPAGVFGLIVLLGFVFLGIFGPYLPLEDPRALRTGPPLHGPTSDNWFGTNNLGQDIFSRVVNGARISLEVSSAAVFLGSGIGAILGILAGYYGRWIDYLLQRSSEAFSAFPSLVLYFLLIAAFGQGVKTIILAIGIGALFGGNRVLRSATMIERNKMYIEAARSTGCSELRVLVRHVVPNVFPYVLVIMSGALGAAILAESALAFLGLGVEPGTPSWGIDMSGANLSYARLGHWYLVAFPGIAISLVVLGANLLGDALRDILDPQLRN